MPHTWSGRADLSHVPDGGRSEGKKLKQVVRDVAEAQHAQQTPDAHNAWTAEIAKLGLLGQSADRITYLWPDNVLTWQCWQGVQTQWRVGMVGATGLDYAGVLAYLQVQGLSPDQRRDVFAGIQACESAMLEVLAEQREREQQAASLPRIPSRM
ncbi:MAG: DUF1799 domain-containing protein [Rhodocyclaceae bacterium]|nr:DUF1799 domain-containing protein [Rhodocyclaceae bacterium]